MTIVHLLIAVAVLLLLIWLAFRLGLFNTSDELLWDRYGAGSKTMVVDGVNIRVKDEGEGPAILLLHGAFGNLNFWDAWADLLTANGYRVVRFDGPPEGITGRDDKGYSHARLAELAGHLADALELHTFAIGGTSRGGAAALFFAAQNEARTTHLVLMNTPVFNYPMPKFPRGVRFAQFLTNTLFAGYRPQFYWQQYLGNLFEDKAALTPAIVQEYTHFSNRVGHRETLKAIQAPGQTRNKEKNMAMAATIRSPTLILATPNNAALSLEHQQILASWFPQGSSELVVMPMGGHFPPLERGKESALIVKDFLERNPVA